MTSGLVLSTDYKLKGYDMNHNFIISYSGEPIILIKNHQFALPSDILAWYAKKYDFDLACLTWSTVDSVVYNPLKILRPSPTET